MRTRPKTSTADSPASTAFSGTIMKPPRSADNELILGLVSISDRASRGVYDDEGIPNLEAWCRKAITTPIKVHKRLIPDERFDIEKTLRELVDIIGCDLILTTGGTGPARRDVTPEATLAVATREMPGFGEQMRAISGHFVPTAILSRQVAVLRETPDHAALIINLPGRPKAIAETLEGLRDDEGKTIVNGIFAAVPYCIDLIGGPYIETDESVVKTFRPKNAVKPKKAEENQAKEAASETPKAEVKSEEVKAPSAKPAEPVSPAEKPAAPRQEAAQKVQDEKPAFAPKDILTVMPRRAQRGADLTVVWLHGMGVDNRDFAPFPD
ncbi:putative molybdopterin biosynthesis mog protein [Sutterella parvirubra YIT 11816]|uniref:Molybdopterin adenylyltransferase n=1 Tax=Sutterella parvirubra YIT 11816 TaxID=762967 RepID=H3KCS4_9BURK|nr:putative molybdopterin biosynthesis mog protein [Sutterella parvirubra YIT 11816]